MKALFPVSSSTMLNPGDRLVVQSKHAGGFARIGELIIDRPMTVEVMVERNHPIVQGTVANNSITVTGYADEQRQNKSAPGDII